MLFSGIDPKTQKHSSPVHLIEMISYLGLPSTGFLMHGDKSHKAFDIDGMWPTKTI